MNAVISIIGLLIALACLALLIRIVTGLTKTRKRKVLRDVWARKGRTFLVSLAIFIGVTGTIALFSMSDILVSQLRQDIQEDQLAMVEIYLETDLGQQLDNAAVLRTILRFPGVTHVMGGESDSATYFKVNPDDEKFESGVLRSSAVWNGDTENPALLDAPFDADIPLEPFRLLTEGNRNEAQGRWPEAGKNELLVEQRMAEEYDLKVNDMLIMRVMSPSRNPETPGISGTEEVWTITGIVFDPYTFTPKTSIYTNLENTNYLSGIVGFGYLWVRFIDYPTAEQSKVRFQDYIAQETPYIPRFLFAEDPANNSLIMNAQLIGNLMGFLALIALIVSGFLVINVISSLVVEQKRQIGVLKSLGATRTDNFIIYSGIALAYGVIGVVPGVLIGIPAGNAAAHALAPQMNTVLEGFRISPSSITLGVIIGLLVPVLSSLIPVFNGTRVRILEAITDLGIDANYGSGLLARLIGKLPISITVRQGLSNISLKKSRLMFTVITLAIAVGAFMGIYAIFASMKQGIQSYIDTFNVQVGVAHQAGDPTQFETTVLKNFGARLYLAQQLGYDDMAALDDYLAGLSETEKETLVRTTFGRDVPPDVLENPDYNAIRSLELGFSVQVEFEGYEPEISPFGPPGIFAYGYDVTSPDPAFRFTIDQGDSLTLDTADTGIIFSSALAYNMGKRVNDRVVMKVPGNSIELEIVGISEFPVDQVWIDWRTLALVANYTFDTVTGGSPLDAFIPDAARSLIKYASAVQVEGYASEGMLPGVLAMGITPSLASYLEFTDGSFFSPGQAGIIISQTMAERGEYDVGDELVLTSLLPGGSTQTYRIVGIFVPSPFMTAQPGPAADDDSEEAGLPIPDDLIGIFWRDLAQDVDGAQVESRLRPQIYFVNTYSDEPQAKDIDVLVDRMNETLIADGFAIFALNFVELTDMISEGFFTIQAILSAVAGLIALVGALGLLTTLSMSVFERQKEIGVMRSIGAGSSTVAAQFLTEGMVVGIIAWIVGLPMMVLVQVALLQIIGPELFPLEFSVTAIIIGFVGMLIITTIASLWPSLGAARKTVSDILRYQ